VRYKAPNAGRSPRKTDQATSDLSRFRRDGADDLAGLTQRLDYQPGPGITTL
jgi:hypothetical protein